MAFNLIHYSHTFCAIFWPEYSISSRVYLRAKGERARVHFPATYFLYFKSELLELLPCFFFVNITKINPLNAKTFSYVRAQACILRFTGLSVVETAKKLEKSECWMVKWSWRNKGFEGKKRRRRQQGLNRAATIVLKKARYKLGDSTRKLTHSEHAQAKSRKGHGKTND